MSLTLPYLPSCPQVPSIHPFLPPLPAWGLFPHPPSVGLAEEAVDGGRIGFDAPVPFAPAPAVGLGELVLEAFDATGAVTAAGSFPSLPPLPFPPVSVPALGLVPLFLLRFSV